MKLKLPKVVLTLLKKRGATVDASLRATRARLVKICEEHQYTPHASVIAFEAAFGGLLIPDEPKQKKGEPCWLFGAYGCLASKSHVAPRGGSKARRLVPVVYSLNDIIYYLDEQGRSYAEDTMEDTSASLFSENGVALVCRIVLHETMFSYGDSSLDLPGLQGETLAKRHSLKLIKEASGKNLRYFSDNKGDILVAEDIKAKQTRLACATKKAFNLVKPPVDKKTPAELIPFLGKSYLHIVGEKRTALPDFFDHLPELRDVDVSINHLETLPESLWRATQLTKLNLSFNPLKVLPEGIANMKALSELSLRGCPIESLPDALTKAKNLTWLIITECEKLDVDAALPVIAKLPKLKKLWLPLSDSLTSLAPLAHLSLKSLWLDGIKVRHPTRLPAGLGQLKKLTDLKIKYADDVSQLPGSLEDVRALRLLFSKHFTDDDIRQSVLKQPENLYLQAYVKTL